jgi:hypothetical protein
VPPTLAPRSTGAKHRSRGWRPRLFAATPWVVAALAASSLAWAVPRAADAERLGDDAAPVGEQVKNAEASPGGIKDETDVLMARIQQFLEQASNLVGVEGKHERRIKLLQSRVEEIEAAYAAKLAAAAAQAE